MTFSTKAFRTLATAGTAMLLFSTFAFAMSQEEKATAARQGLMKLIVWEAGPLFAMAKGDMEYDAETAATRAENLALLASYAGYETLFVPGTSTDELGDDKTSALPSIWQDEAKFHQGFDALEEKAALVAAEAGKGPDELRAAMGELGKSCGNCHESFRLKK